MNPMALIGLVPVLVQLASLVQEMCENWGRDDYKPVMPDEIMEALERLQSLEDLPEE